MSVCVCVCVCVRERESERESEREREMKRVGAGGEGHVAVLHTTANLAGDEIAERCILDGVGCDPSYHAQTSKQAKQIPDQQANTSWRRKEKNIAARGAECWLRADHFPHQSVCGRYSDGQLRAPR